MGAGKNGGGAGKGKKTASLFVTMLKIGLFTFGGGYAMLALLEHEFVENRKWLEKDEFLDMAAIAESTPGPIAINAATYIGYTQAGLRGALVATVGVCIPSFVILYAISLYFDAFLKLKPVACAFRGIQVCVVYLILSAGLKLFKSLPKGPLETLILGAVTLSMVACSLLAVRFSVVLCILSCGLLGLAWGGLRSREKKGGKEK